MAVTWFVADGQWRACDVHTSLAKPQALRDHRTGSAGQDRKSYVLPCTQDDVSCLIWQDMPKRTQREQNRHISRTYAIWHDTCTHGASDTRKGKERKENITLRIVNEKPPINRDASGPYWQGHGAFPCVFLIVSHPKALAPKAPSAVVRPSGRSNRTWQVMPTKTRSQTEPR